MRGRADWRRTLTPAQKETIDRIRVQHTNGTKQRGTEGWTVYMMPTTKPAIYCELRRYTISGHVARWVIERDGTISRAMAA